MLSATADTNIYTSGLEFGGLPERFLQLARDGAFRLDISESIEQEVLREKFNYQPRALFAAKVLINRITHRVSFTETVEVITTDPSDNRILECAVAAKSDFIVSGDVKHVLALGSHARFQTVSVTEFLEILKRA